MICFSDLLIVDHVSVFSVYRVNLATGDLICVPSQVQRSDVVQRLFRLACNLGEEGGAFNIDILHISIVVGTALTSVV